MSSRRAFLKTGAVLPAVSLYAADPAESCQADSISLNGAWDFRFDPDRTGEAQAWHKPSIESLAWRTVRVPHTWQVETGSTEYMGAAWYRRAIDVPVSWREAAVRVEFEAVFHTATVWLNGTEVGRHIGKGYTTFVVDLSSALQFGRLNTLVVRADNSFSETMLPRGRSSDWAHDGGIYRPVRLLVTPKVFIERVRVDSDVDPASREAVVTASAVVRNAATAAWSGVANITVVDDSSGLPVGRLSAEMRVDGGQAAVVRFEPLKITKAQLWHFDHPHLYKANVRLSNGHTLSTEFGIRKIEARAVGFYLNGERVRLMGVERMAGSNPEFGMAEPTEWIEHDHSDMRELNCIYTRVHWPQDRRVLDWCDRHGMLIQTEVPTWGPNTFQGMEREPSTDILNNGLEQLREMIERDCNHPCIFSWGVCNEINGQNPPAAAFARRMYEEAKRLDPRRLVTYASNSLQKTPGKDVAGLMDYIMWNEYYESWYSGTPADLARNLDEIHAAFPDKAIVISEYGYCACTADRPEGDARRTEILRAHDEVFRNRGYVAGLIFFDYNDYRTHVGDRGTGAAKQRVHGVVDLYGNRKRSWEVLRHESSPVDSIHVAGKPPGLHVTIASRRSLPSYPLRGYRLRGVAYGFGNIPVERVETALDVLDPGQQSDVELNFSQPAIVRIQLDVLRPDGYSVRDGSWQY